MKERPLFLPGVKPGRGTYRQIKTGTGFKLKNKNGPFSSVWTATIARIGAFFSIFRALQGAQSFAPLKTHFFSKTSFLKSAIFAKFQQILHTLQNLQNVAEFQKFQIDNLVDFKKC